MRVKPEDLDAFVRSMKPGESFVYHVGYLPADRMSVKFVPLTAAEREVDVIARIAWAFYEQRKVTLVQRRLGTRKFSYEMQRLSDS